jgi:dihydropteroate synthase
MLDAHQTSVESIDCMGIELNCGKTDRALVMGVLNVTPDSFSDGGLFVDTGKAAAHASHMLDAGADIIDIGGESSRPAGATYGKGAQPVSLEEELERVIPVIRRIVEHHPDVVISIDTYKSEVARAALDAGARIINDITAFRADPGMPEVAARAGAPVILMHSVGLPGSMPHASDYLDVVAEVKSALAGAVVSAEKYGISDVIVDPGFGFGKTVSENLMLVARLAEFADLGRPVLVGVSRKSSIGSALEPDGTPRPVDGRLYGSLAATAVAIMNGAAIIRTHDVRATRDVAQVVHALVTARRTVAEEALS